LLVLFAACVSFAQTPAQTTAPAGSNNADAYYHFAMGRLYAELAGSAVNQSQYIAKAIEQYQAALKLEPTEGMILEELADIYIQTGRLQDAIDEANGVLKDNPDNLEARRLLGRIYTRGIADAQGGRINQDMVRQATEQYQKITEKDPKDADSWVVLGRLYRVSNNTAEAEKAYNAALQADPQNEDALTGLAMLYADQGDTSRAIEKLKAATDKNPTEETLAALADTYERARDFKSAADALKRAVALSPDSGRLQASLAQDLFLSDQLDEALKIYQSLAGDDPHDTQTQLRIAEICRDKGDLKKAREALEKAKQIDPTDVDTLYEEVNLLDAEGKTDAAITQLKALVSSTERGAYSPTQASYRARLFERLGLLYSEAGQHAQATDAFRQIGSLGGDFGARSAALVIDSYRQAKDFTSALREAEAAAKKYPDDQALRVAQAEVLSDQGKIDEAVAVVRALPKGEDSRELQIELAQIYEKGKRWTDMGKAIDAAEKLSSADDEKETVWFMRGAMYERMKKFDLSEAEFRKVIQANPQNAGALNYLGYMLADRDVRLDEAHDLVKKALDLDPRNGAYLDSMGWVYYHQGKFSQAEELLVQALDRIGQDATVHDHLGDVYLKLGKTKEAIAQWQASVREFQNGSPTDNDPEEVAKVTKKLENARVRLAKEAK
jgi:tetratricopeptide (TPR) repeat protein